MNLTPKPPSAYTPISKKTSTPPVYRPHENTNSALRPTSSAFRSTGALSAPNRYSPQTAKCCTRCGNAGVAPCSEKQVANAHIQAKASRQFGMETRSAPPVYRPPHGTKPAQSADRVLMTPGISIQPMREWVRRAATRAAAPHAPRPTPPPSTAPVPIAPRPEDAPSTAAAAASSHSAVSARTETVEVVAGPLAVPLGAIFHRAGIGHLQVCRPGSARCVGFGPDGAHEEDRRAGHTLTVEVDSVAAVERSVRSHRGRWIPAVNDCQTAAMEALRRAGASHVDIERVSQFNLALQSPARAARYERRERYENRFGRVG